ncbi:RNA polymerase sigma factor, sigma-70 family [Limihaloglobus sulfuriphilus]|uniref:RNA polymerase sigma factor, sigma-70 family n=1 Tax=Limihaloglobus sulfuriphilus TaxID=1851148 RepID=A0A1Q2MG63_9BACT|nr:sigma factor-like helix-turn-helix DNA-binding protein [Limihaloglobus sulfuriphilus]AQQ71297.1 RNA polymerase sigma factor, sigma-70 family [Limihaloglobus sulfuriphilus]
MSTTNRQMEYLDSSTALHMHAYREHINKLIRRSRMLDRLDRVIVRLYFIDGYSLSQIAAIRGASRAAMQRRFKRILRRLKSPEFCGYMRLHLHMEGVSREVGRRYFFRGVSIQKIAQETGLSIYRVRQIIAQIRKEISESFQNEAV